MSVAVGEELNNAFVCAVGVRFLAHRRAEAGLLPVEVVSVTNTYNFLSVFTNSLV